ncbi:hypothetical protein ATE84_4334 [Aquimarina sp. MAR_2010_214]|uniref:hypothetical protein n=1 Tax=Aquimarina sp. MAR_2010_214 TaxID=1250026 RepID=UPI000C704BA1|nr:hypothetical protein [Aquimarina sp. MAR_2010_214]PKV52227.1 hypothetical protein ATE84_4334 [Aquimarina sp. MAR_2010_214]
MTDYQEFLLIFFNEAKAKFFQKEKRNILSGVSERNLCGRLSIYLETLLEKYELENYYSDPEYNRKQNERVKTILDENMEVVTINCDLIVHSRGERMDSDNLIAIEMKKSNRPEAEKISDKLRLRALTKASYDGIWSYDGKAHPEHVCGYQLGIYIEINNDDMNYLIEGFISGEKVFDTIEFF